MLNTTIRKKAKNITKLLIISYIVEVSRAFEKFKNKANKLIIGNYCIRKNWQEIIYNFMYSNDTRTPTVVISLAFFAVRQSFADWPFWWHDNLMSTTLEINLIDENFFFAECDFCKVQSLEGLIGFLWKFGRNYKLFIFSKAKSFNF